jgi:hypothetical protein
MDRCFKARGLLVVYIFGLSYRDRDSLPLFGADIRHVMLSFQGGELSPDRHFCEMSDECAQELHLRRIVREDRIGMETNPIPSLQLVSLKVTSERRRVDRLATAPQHQKQSIPAIINE